MGFGLSFGKKKVNTSRDITSDTTETGTQSGTESTNSTNNTSSSGTSTTNNNSIGSSSTTQSTNQAGNTATNTNRVGSQSSFSDELAGGVEGSIQSLLGGIGEASSAIGNGINSISDFDASGFVRGIMDSAASRQNIQLDESINGLVDNIGGGVGSNSMSALLASRLQNDAASNLAGIRSQAEGQAQGILRDNLGATASSAASINTLAPALLSALRGGNVQTTESATGSEVSNVTGNTTGVTNTSESGTSGTSTTQDSTQILQSIVDQLMNSTTNNRGTQNINESTKSGGGGFSLGF